MKIGVRQQREKARAVDRDRELALVARLGPGDARRDDLAVLVDEFLEDADVLVVDLLHLLRGEAAEPPAPEQLVAPAARVLALALGELALAFTLAAAARPAAATVTLSLHRHDLFLYRPCFRCMQYHLCAHAVLPVKKPAHLDRLARFQPGHGHRHFRHRHPAHLALDLAFQPGFDLARLVHQLESEHGYPGRGIAQGFDGSELAAQSNLVCFHSYVAADSSAAGAAGAGAGLAPSSPAGAFSDLDFSSFIIGLGAVTASLILTMRWRNTASLNLKAWSSSPNVSLSTSTFIRT